jgi:hypothetical protein
LVHNYIKWFVSNNSFSGDNLLSYSHYKLFRVQKSTIVVFFVRDLSYKKHLLEFIAVFKKVYGYSLKANRSFVSFNNALVSHKENVFDNYMVSDLKRHNSLFNKCMHLLLCNNKNTYYELQNNIFKYRLLREYLKLLFCVFFMQSKDLVSLNKMGFIKYVYIKISVLFPKLAFLMASFIGLVLERALLKNSTLVYLTESFPQLDLVLGKYFTDLEYIFKNTKHTYNICSTQFCV